MKLGEALSLRADLQKRAQQILGRITANVVTQEGEDPQEDPHALLTSWHELWSEYEKLVAQINFTNTNTNLANSGESITQALARREVLGVRLNGLRQVVSTLGERGFRYSRTEIKEVKHMSARVIQEEVDRLGKELRELDTEIQAHNWTTDLIEN